MHLNTGWRPLITPPRGPKKKQGVFATRAPHRPNHISLSALRVVSVDEDEGHATEGSNPRLTGRLPGRAWPATHSHV